MDEISAAVQTVKNLKAIQNSFWPGTICLQVSSIKWKAGQPFSQKKCKKEKGVEKWGTGRVRPGR